MAPNEHSPIAKRILVSSLAATAIKSGAVSVGVAVAGPVFVAFVFIPFNLSIYRVDVIFQYFKDLYPAYRF
jgi:hypothetical protein